MSDHNDADVRAQEDAILAKAEQIMAMRRRRDMEKVPYVTRFLPTVGGHKGIGQDRRDIQTYFTAFGAEFIISLIEKETGKRGERSGSRNPLVDQHEIIRPLGRRPTDKLRLLMTRHMNAIYKAIQEEDDQ